MDVTPGTEVTFVIQAQLRVRDYRFTAAGFSGFGFVVFNISKAPSGE
jgi:hypothetical protein